MLYTLFQENQVLTMCNVTKKMDNLDKFFHNYNDIFEIEDLHWLKLIQSGITNTLKELKNDFNCDWYYSILLKHKSVLFYGFNQENQVITYLVINDSSHWAKRFEFLLINDDMLELSKLFGSQKLDKNDAQLIKDVIPYLNSEEQMKAEKNLLQKI